ncbi:MAG: hypothetical protein COV30_00155 [Candidatus Yanofskybacteria bacterium CG10_big_fil_rev_8_21_14_0_10_37_15]|uniref:Uncharacterized protein n=1 Tax=Candidatus Yanofskybacteria bacterium CG10_big_fil_rev_8_21_14_0_10_37_15 TaxID=1975097 RepID=A0A2H0R6H7_9BACT|nr:MAG: hypothetical protein COV30_00155 [Candidatus Yanofskybacteria bacterium CG10_big_fil_rev_8_21_14_0_10_37_15]
MNNTKKFAYAGMVIMALMMPVLVLALTGPTQPIGGTPVSLSEIENRIRQIAQFVIVISVILAVIFIIWGGIAYMTAGGDDTKAKTAKTRIWNGVIGAAIVLAVGVILQTLASLISRSFFG